LCAVVLMFYLPAVLAQEATTAPVPNDVERVIATLEDDQKRAQLLQQLRLLNDANRAIDSPQTSSSSAEITLELSQWVDSISARLLDSLSTLANLPYALGELGPQLINSGKTTDWFQIIAKIAAVLLCAWLVRAAVQRLLKRPRTNLEDSTPETWFSKFIIQFGRALLDFIGIGAFAICAYLILSLARLDEIPQLVSLAIINVFLLTRSVVVFARMIFSPDFGELRLIPAGDGSAQYWFLWIRRLSTVSVYGYVIIETVFLLGLPVPTYKVLLNLLGLVVLSMLIIVIQQSRRDLAEKIAGSQPETALMGVFRRQLAAFWNVFAILYLIFVYSVWVADIPGEFYYIGAGTALSLLIIIVATCVGFGFHRIIDHGFHLSEQLRVRIPSLDQRANRYVLQLKAVASILVCTIATITILDVWGLNISRWFENDMIREIGSRLGSIILIMSVAYIVWEILNISIEHGLTRARETSEEHGRLETLLPLGRKTAMLVILTLVSMIVLSELGINIGPLLAAAGVLGLAVGFGAQTLVKDIITGVFILFENSISVGDYIEVGGHEGEVENVSIRTIQLRDIEGSVHTVPFSSVSTVLNYTRDFGISKMDIGVAYREDIDRVVEVLNQIGSEMLEEPELAKDILKPLVVQGVQSLGDSSVNIRARIKTTAGMQWAMRREFYRRVKNRFDELGIEIPFPHQTIYFGVDQQGQAPAAQVQLKPLADK